MKIICESKDEYDKLMEASKYIHDYMVWVKHSKKKAKVSFAEDIHEEIKVSNDEICFGLDMDIEMVNTIAHLYNSEGIVEINTRTCYISLD
jgi:hypothetical protein